jgi:hypothetical protein
LPAPINLAITQNGNSLAISGTLSTLNVFDFITGSAHFAITRQAVDVDLDGDGNAATGEQLNDAGLLTIGLDQLNVTIGGAGTGLSVTSGTLGIAILSAPVVAGDTRSWTAITGKDIAISLQCRDHRHRGPGLGRRQSRVGGKNGTPAIEVNWVKADRRHQRPDRPRPDRRLRRRERPIDPGQTLAPIVVMLIAIRGRKLAVAGRLTNLNIFDLISAVPTSRSRPRPSTSTSTAAGRPRTTGSTTPRC